MDVPMYPDKETMKKNVLIAVRLCGEVDSDGNNPLGGQGLDTANTQLTNVGSGSSSNRDEGGQFI